MAPSNEKVWIGGGALAALLIAGLAWMFVINPQLSSTSSLKSQTASAQEQNDILRIKIAKLRKDNADLPKLMSDLKQARAGLPTDSGLTDFTRQLTAEAGTHHLALGAITVGGAKAAGTPTSATGLDAIAVTLTATGTADDMQAFLADVQYTGTRRVLLTSMQLSPSSSAKIASIAAATSATIQLSVFSAPQSAAAEAQLQKQLGAGTGGG